MMTAMASIVFTMTITRSSRPRSGGRWHNRNGAATWSLDVTLVNLFRNTLIGVIRAAALAGFQSDQWQEHRFNISGLQRWGMVALFAVAGLALVRRWFLGWRSAVCFGLGYLGGNAISVRYIMFVLLH